MESNNNILSTAIEDTFDRVMKPYHESAEYKEEVSSINKQEATFVDTLSPEQQSQYREVLKKIKTHVANYVSDAYVRGVEYGLTCKEEFQDSL